MALSLKQFRKLFADVVPETIVALDDRRVRARKRASEKTAAIVVREEERLRGLEQHERRARKNGFRCVAGVDEVGRGPLAGPLVAAAVVFERQPWIPLLDDSKKLSEEEREALFELIHARAVSVGIGVIPVEELNGLNLHIASLEAMRRALRRLTVPPDMVLVDGRFCIPCVTCAQQSLIKGDRLSISIAAASIVAKVTRDRHMDEMHRRWPGYGFTSHKGYGTEEHLAALRSLGPSPIHRVRFRPVAELMAPPTQLLLWEETDVRPLTCEP